MTLTTAKPKTALVTGSGRRIGAAIITHLHNLGFKVIIHCHQSASEGEKLVEHLNSKRANSSKLAKVDLKKPNSPLQLIKKALCFGSLDVLVNNASVFFKDELIEKNPKLWQELFWLNVRIPYLLSTLAFPYLAKKHGSIINITDIHAQKPLAKYDNYCQSKAALNCQTLALAKMFAPKVRVNAIAPGAIMWPEHNNEISASIKNKIINTTPLKIHGDPSWLAEAALMLINNPFVTGQILAIDGGRLLN